MVCRYEQAWDPLAGCPGGCSGYKGYKYALPEQDVAPAFYQRQALFGVLGPRCWTGLSMLDCHVLKGFGIYIIGILGSLSDEVLHVVHSSCNLLVNIKGLESTFFSLSASDEAAAS